MTHDDHKQTVPHVPLAENDIRVLETILQGNIGYLRNSSPLKYQTIQRIQQLQDLRERLLFLCASGTGHSVQVTYDDVRVIREAMKRFVTLTRQIVPQSTERDETLLLVDQLRQHLEAYFSLS